MQFFPLLDNGWEIKPGCVGCLPIHAALMMIAPRSQSFFFFSFAGPIEGKREGNGPLVLATEASFAAVRGLTTVSFLRTGSRAIFPSVLLYEERVPPPVGCSQYSSRRRLFGAVDTHFKNLGVKNFRLKIR